MEIELERRYVLLNGQKYEPEQIDEMTVSEIDALSFSLRAKKRKHKRSSTRRKRP